MPYEAATGIIYEALKNFREVSPNVRSHVKRVYLTLCDALITSAVGLYLHILFNIGKMPKEFPQSSLRPILVNLVRTKNLSMPLLQCLARLLELFTNYFDVTLGGKLLEHLKKWLELDKLAQSQKLKPLTKHLREKMQIVASELLELWRKIVIKATAKNKKAEPLVPSRYNVEKTNWGETVKVEKINKDERRASIVKKPSESPAVPPKVLSLVKCNDLRANFRRLEEAWHQSLLFTSSLLYCGNDTFAGIITKGITELNLLDHNELQARQFSPEIYELQMLSETQVDETI
ncbi:putative transcription elongation factor s-II [Corchorus olitorius]|uniref:Transcription elongation factor s-II n=1 Tax=Corchorus olitorius TaxID=93759 RepID=A0A1R3G2D5_9ROSI|nr:putative transcription elongation factor s-II [Corchorus olitorius]